MSEERLVDEVIARYVRAADHRDGAAMTELFTEDALVEIYVREGGGFEPLGQVRGASQIGEAVAGMMAPHPLRGWSHHTTLNHIVSVEGDQATLDAHFVVYNVVGDAQPEGGWPAQAIGAQGTITPIESGYLRSQLQRVGGAWKIDRHTIEHDLPYALPQG